MRDYGSELAAALSSTGNGEAAPGISRTLPIRAPAIRDTPPVAMGTLPHPPGFSLAGLVACGRLVAERSYRAGSSDAFAGVEGLLERFAGEIADDSACELSRAQLLERLGRLSLAVAELGAVVRAGSAAVDEGFDLWAAGWDADGAVRRLLRGLRPGVVAGFVAAPEVVAERFRSEFLSAVPSIQEVI